MCLLDQHTAKDLVTDGVSQHICIGQPHYSLFLFRRASHAQRPIIPKRYPAYGTRPILLRHSLSQARDVDHAWVVSNGDSNLEPLPCAISQLWNLFIRHVSRSAEISSFFIPVLHISQTRRHRRYWRFSDISSSIRWHYSNGSTCHKLARISASLVSLPH